MSGGRVERTITQEQLGAYADASGDHNPIHTDPVFAAGTMFEGTIAHGMLVLALLGEAMHDITGGAWLTSGRMKVRFKAPTRPGDTVTASAEVTKAGEYAVSCVNQRGEVLVEGRAWVGGRMSDVQPARGVMCFACGAKNDRGLHMRFRQEGDRAVCDYTPCEYQQGYPNRMHGGVVATLIDEAMGWAVYGGARWGATARLNLRFRKPVPLDAPLRVEAWIVRDRARLLELRGELRDASGTLLAEADGTFMKLDERMGAQMSDVARSIGRDDAP